MTLALLPSIAIHKKIEMALEGEYFRIFPRSAIAVGAQTTFELPGRSPPISASSKVEHIVNAAPRCISEHRYVGTHSRSA
jgi:hypothetical protein